MVTASIEPFTDIGAHIAVIGCRMPDFLPPSESVPNVWSCGETFMPVESSLPVASMCNDRTKYVLSSNFDNAKHSMSFPVGFGIPMAGDTGIDYLLLNIHIESLTNLINGRTGTTGVVVTLRSTDFIEPHAVKVGSITTFQFGHLPPHDVKTIEGSFIIKDNITLHPLGVVTHTHKYAIRAYFKKRDPQDGRQSVIWSQDPRHDVYYHDVDQLNVTLGQGDELIFGCVFNNTLSKAVRIR